MFTEDTKNRVRERTDIVDLVSGYVSLRKAGKNWLGLCPFHAEKTPSFNVNPDKQIFHCFGCGVGGDVFKFIEMQEGLTFPEAVRKLADRAGVAIAETRARGGEQQSGDERRLLGQVMTEAEAYFRAELQGPAGSAARSYLAARGVSEVVIGNFSLGYSRPEWDGLLRHLRLKGRQPGLLEKAGLVIRRSEGEGHYDRFRGRIIFPIRDLAGAIVGFGGRVMDDTLPKYLNSPETPLYSKSNVLYGLDRAKDAGRKLGYFIIVEGYLDAIACHQHGVQNAVATLGTALTDGHLRLLKRFAQKLVLIFDPDPAGVKATLRSFDLFAGSGMKVNVVSLPGGDDPDTFLKKRGAEAFAEHLRTSSKFMDFVLQQTVRDGAAAPIDEKVERAGTMLGYLSRIPNGIERDHYLKKTAEALDVDEGLLRQELKTVRTPAGPKAGGAAPGERPAARPKAEEMLIHLMLRDAAFAGKVLEQIAPGDFTDPLFRRAADRVRQVLDRGGAFGAQELMADDDEELNRLIAHYAVLDAEYHDPDKVCADCVDRIRQQGSARQLKALQTSIREAEARGDGERLKELLEEMRRKTRQSKA